MGAPRKHPQKDAAEIIERLAAEGRAIIGIAKHLGVSRETFKAWCERDESLQEAFEIGRDAHKQYLVTLIMQAAALNKGANANAMFLLKTMHQFRENDSPSTKVDVGLNVAQNVLVVHSHGSDEDWQAKAIEQQRSLVANAASVPKQIEATIETPVYAPPVESAPAWIAVHMAKEIPQQTAPEAPAWRGNT